MKVILSVDLITPPITGIGRYALELARNLSQLPENIDLRYFYFGRWISQQQLDALAQPGSGIQSAQKSWRSRFAANRMAVYAYSKLMPMLSGLQLRHEHDAVFHSPNYFLPPFPGRSIATVHDLSHVWFPKFHPTARRELLARELPKTLERANFLITDAESVRKEIIAHFGWPENKIAAIPLGVDSCYQPRTDAQLFASLSQWGLSPGGYSLYVGTIEPRKNLIRLITAYEMLPEKLRRQWPLVLAGSRGWQSEDIHHRMRKAADEGWLRYLDYVPQSELPALYAGARLFAFPSLYEGFGLPPLEAMASGVPVITSNTSSLPEVVGNAAITIQPEDTQAINTALHQALEDETWREKSIRAGVVRAAELTWEMCAFKTYQIYARTYDSAVI